MNTQPAIINTIAKHIGSYPDVKKVILFGSRARGDERERSDIDIAVVGPEITEKEWLALQGYVDEEAETLLSIDLVRYESAPNHLKVRIAREGITLYERH